MNFCSIYHLTHSIIVVLYVHAWVYINLYMHSLLVVRIASVGLTVISARPDVTASLVSRPLPLDGIHVYLQMCVRVCGCEYSRYKLFDIA